MRTDQGPGAGVPASQAEGGPKTSTLAHQDRTTGPPKRAFGEAKKTTPAPASPPRAPARPRTHPTLPRPPWRGARRGRPAEQPPEHLSPQQPPRPGPPYGRRRCSRRGRCPRARCSRASRRRRSRRPRPRRTGRAAARRRRWSTRPSRSVSRPPSVLRVRMLQPYGDQRAGRRVEQLVRRRDPDQLVAAVVAGAADRGELRVLGEGVVDLAVARGDRLAQRLVGDQRRRRRPCSSRRPARGRLSATTKSSPCSLNASTGPGAPGPHPRRAAA